MKKEAAWLLSKFHLQYYKINIITKLILKRSYTVIDINGITDLLKWKLTFSPSFFDHIVIVILKYMSNYTNIWANLGYVSIFCLIFTFDYLVMYVNKSCKFDWICIYEVCVESG